MGKYAATLQAVLGVFGSSEWLAESISTYPSNYVGADPGNRYIRVHVIPQETGLNLRSASGQVIVDIFTSAGSGPMEPAEIADRLDAFLLGKSRTIPEGTVQFGNSVFRFSGADKANPALHRSAYQIPFNYFGV